MMNNLTDEELNLTIQLMRQFWSDLNEEGRTEVRAYLKKWDAGFDEWSSVYDAS